MKRYGIWIGVVGILLGLGYWGYKGMTKPLPGQLMPDLGRDHVVDISEIQYNSNPPTSGSHFPVWAKKGVYDRVISDGYLVHSLEHGYIVISYNCSQPLATQHSLITDVYAHDGVDHRDEEPIIETTESDGSKPLTKMTVQQTDTTSWITPDSPPPNEVNLPDSFNSDSCKNLIQNLSQFPNEWQRVVVVPRIDMDYPIALTAWRRLETLNSFDKSTIEEFIKAYHNLGPEKTME